MWQASVSVGDQELSRFDNFSELLSRCFLQIDIPNAISDIVMINDVDNVDDDNDVGNDDDDDVDNNDNWTDAPKQQEESKLLLKNLCKTVFAENLPITKKTFYLIDGN